MPDEVWHQLEVLIRRGDLEGVVAALEPLDERTRRKLAPLARRESDKTRNDAAEAAVYGTGGASAAVRGWWDLSDHRVLRDRLIRARPREWRQDWAERVLADEISARWDWAIVHLMVKDGLIERPQAPEYVTGAVLGMRELDLAGGWRNPRQSLTQALRGEGEWLADDLWRLFEIEETPLAGTEIWMAAQGLSWQDALCELAADGTVPRDRLLDQSLTALRRDFSPYHARWFRKLHEALEPTPDEHAARQDELLALLASEDPAVVAFAVRALAKLERAKRLDAGALFDAIAPALVVPVKGHATRAAKLAGRALKRSPEHAPVALGILIDALAHEAREVQEAAVDVIETHRHALTDADSDRLAALVSDVDPSLRGRVQALAGGGQEAVADAGPAVAVPGRRPPEPVRPVPLEPVRDLDDLLDRAAVALEHGEADELELVLDGVSRLREAPVDPARARALVERAEALVTPWQGEVGFHHARDALAAVLLRWLGGREYRRLRLEGTGSSPREAIAARVRELLGELPGGRSRALLSAPTHRGGWIEPAVAVRRVAALEGRRPPVMDLAQMVLRLAPDGRDPASAGLDGEAGAVLAHALGGSVRRPWRVRLGAAWDAAEQARDPAAYAVPDHDLAGGHAAFEESLYSSDGSPADAASPATLLTGREAWWGWEPGGIERWLTTVWPANKEGVFQIVARRLWINDGTREYGIGEVLEVLLDPSEPIGEQAALALALGLGTADAADRTLAADVTIAALTSRRLDGDALGARLARLLREQQLVVPARWEGSLGDVAATGPLAAYDAQAAIETVLAAATDDDRRRLLGVVELLRRLAVEADAAVADPRARAWLEALPPRSKGGKAAREALAVTGGGAARSRAAAASLS